MQGQEGELEHLKTCAWNHDLDKVILEMPNENGKGTTDADMSSNRALLHEMEEEEVVDCTINGHECERAPACGEGAAAADSADYFVIKPKPTPIYFQWSPPSLTSSCKYTSLANVFSEKVLQASRVLHCVWRVAYLKEANELTPRKPLYFLRGTTDLTMDVNECIRLL